MIRCRPDCFLWLVVTDVQYFLEESGCFWRCRTDHLPSGEVVAVEKRFRREGFQLEIAKLNPSAPATGPENAPGMTTGSLPIDEQRPVQLHGDLRAGQDRVDAMSSVHVGSE